MIDDITGFGIRKSTILVQQLYRAKILGQKARADFVKVKETALYIQSKLRANSLMKQQRAYYNKLKDIIRKIFIPQILNLYFSFVNVFILFVIFLHPQENSNIKQNKMAILLKKKTRLTRKYVCYRAITKQN